MKATIYHGSNPIEIEVPDSVLTKHQVKRFGPKVYVENGRRYRITVQVRFDDECGNGHNSFGITADIMEKDDSGRWRDFCGGCCHTEVIQHFPELAPFIKWHLCSADGPMHYLGNTIYHASDRDHWGLRKGEFKQATHRRSGKPMWQLQSVHEVCPDTCIGADSQPPDVVLKWEAVNVGTSKVGEGKARDLDAARSCAVWPEASDEELMAPDLKDKLLARLPALMIEFKSAMESLGFTY